MDEDPQALFSAKKSRRRTMNMNNRRTENRTRKAVKQGKIPTGLSMKERTKLVANMKRRASVARYRGMNVKQVLIPKKTKKAKKLGLKYLEKASKFLDFLTKNAESFGKKKYDRHAMIATAIQNHLRDKNTLREIGRNVNVTEENPFTFIDDLYNDIQELFEEYHEEDNHDTKIILQEQMILLTVVINEAVGIAKKEYGQQKEKSSRRSVRRNETMNSVRSGISERQNADDKDVDELAAMFKGL
jgi:hypothetical protein